VARHGAQQGILILDGQGAQGVGQGRSDLPSGQLVLGRGGQPRPDVHPAGHPLGFALQLAGDTRRAQALLAHQRAHHPRLIQCGQGAGRTVGQKQQAFVLGRGAGGLDHHGDEPVALLAPSFQALEAVEDLVQTLFGGHHADGQRSHLFGGSPRGSGSQRRVAAAQLLERQHAEAAGRRGRGERVRCSHGRAGVGRHGRLLGRRPVVGLRRGSAPARSQGAPRVGRRPRAAGAVPPSARVPPGPEAGRPPTPPE
jgi:hypothetical protein